MHEYLETICNIKAIVPNFRLDSMTRVLLRLKLGEYSARRPDQSADRVYRAPQDTKRHFSSIPCRFSKYKTHCIMAAKEEISSTTTDTKTEETPDNSTTEDAPTSLETIPEGNVARNGVQIAPKDKSKIDILLKATANAPIMKQKKWSVCQDNPIGRISEFIKKYLKLDPNERLFLYVNQTFAPAPDQTVKNLYDCYGADGKLVIHYCKSQAWG